MENRILLLSGLSLKQSESLCSSYTPVDFVLSLVNRSQMCSSWQDGKHQTHQILWSVGVQKSSEVSVDNSALSCCPCGGLSLIFGLEAELSLSVLDWKWGKQREVEA